MIRAFKTILAIVFAAVVLVVGGLALSAAGFNNPISDAVDGTKNAGINAAIDASGIKEKADSELRENASKISEMTGMPRSAVDSMIDGLDIQSWKVTSLPANAVAQDTANVQYAGTNAQLTTYDDPSVITVTTDAGAVTLEVPTTAQGYIKYLGYL
ncbi:MAG: hypothetical protein HFJ65_05300 [Eggerthellaceae bacterium]|nr:hypothetical protein [Eggerthellaceae bacterium]